MVGGGRFAGQAGRSPRCPGAAPARTSPALRLPGMRGGERAFPGMMARITIYTTDWCGYCARAKRLLEERGLAYEEITIDTEPNFRERLLELTGGWTVPQIVIDGKPIGGYLELWRLDRGGLLERLAA